MKEIIEKKLGCSIEECYKRMVDFCKGGSSTPCYLANLTDEEFNYMMEEINKINPSERIELEGEKA